MPGLEEIELYPVDVSDKSSLVPRFEALLAPFEKERAAGFHFYCDRARFIVMRGVLRLILSSRLDTEAACIGFGENRYGKPSVPGGIDFSISYSGDMGIIAVAGIPVGVDIEKMDPAKVTVEMIEEVFSEGEKGSYLSGVMSEDVVTFFRGWVRKEAIAKAIGKGLSCPPSQVESRLEEKAFIASHGGIEWWTCEFGDWRPEYEAALTSAYKGEPPVVTVRSTDALVPPQ